MPPPEVVVTTVVVAVGVAVLLWRRVQARAKKSRAAAARAARVQRLNDERARELKAQLTALGQLAEATERYWGDVAAGGDLAADRAAMAEYLAAHGQRLPLTAGVFLSGDLTAGEQQGYLAQYAEETLAGGVRFEIRRELEHLGAALWMSLTDAAGVNDPSGRQDQEASTAK